MNWIPRFAPVAIVELVAVARRWQTFVARGALVMALGVTLALVCLSYQSGVLLIGGSLKMKEYAEAGTNFAVAVLGVQLALVLFAAPAAAAGAICLDKSRGNLTLLMATDMSASEFVIGKLFGRLLPVLSLVIVSLPLLFITTLLGGINAELIIGGFIVLTGAAVLCSSIALLMSLYATRTQEALLLAFVLVFGWLALEPVTRLITTLPAIGRVSRALWATNPFRLLLAPLEPKLGLCSTDYAIYLACTLGMASTLTMLAVFQLRRVVLTQANRPIRLRGAKAFHRRRSPKKLDRDPLGWYERYRHRPSFMGRMTRGVVVSLSLFSALAAIFLSRLGPGFGDLPNWVCVTTVGIGLLYIVISAVSSMAGERSRGSLDILATTPYTTPAILWAKWRAAFGLAPWLLLLPWFVAFTAYWGNSDKYFRNIYKAESFSGALDTLFLAVVPPLLFLALPIGLITGFVLAQSRSRFGAVLAIGLSILLGFFLVCGGVPSSGLPILLFTYFQPLACAAMLTSIGLFLALQLKNFARAISVAVAIYIVLSVGWPFMLQLLGASIHELLALHMLSPIAAAGVLDSSNRYWDAGDVAMGALISTSVYLATAVYFYIICLIIANRKMGRISRTESRPIPPEIEAATYRNMLRAKR